MSGADGTLECTITGLTAAATIIWATDGKDITNVDNIEEGTFSDGTQITTLTIKAATESKTYKCKVTPDKADGGVEVSAEATLTIRGELKFDQDICYVAVTLSEPGF